MRGSCAASRSPISCTCWLLACVCREPLESLRETAADCVQEFHRLKHERRMWAKLPAEQRAVQPYPIAPVPPVDRVHRLYCMTETAAWSLLPACPSLHTEAAVQLPLLLLPHDCQRSEQQQREAIKQERED